MAYVPNVRLSLLVSAADAHRLNLLAEFVEENRTAIGQTISASLHAPKGPAAAELIRQVGGLGIPVEGHAQTGRHDYLTAGDGNQTSMVEAWAATPAEMELPPLRCDGSMDLVRQRQWESYAGFLANVRLKRGA